MIKKLLCLTLAVAMLAGAALTTAGADAVRADGAPVVALAWRADVEDGYYDNVSHMLDEMGVEHFLMERVVYNGAAYEGRKLSDECVEPSGMLSEDCAQAIRRDWESSNVAEVAAARDFDLIIFSGGADVSPSLQAVPDVERNGGEAFDATRDVSDYILLRYCFEHDIPVLCICRGMQMLAVASDGSVLQDISDYYAELGRTDSEYHRMSAGNENRDFAAHDVDIVDKSSMLYAIAQTDVIEDVPSWHHQAVLSVEGTPLKATATTTLGGVEIIEAIERTDLSFVLGIQFHLEGSVVKSIKQVANAEKYTDKDECIAFFNRLLDYVMSLKQAEAA